jgi:opacity protein-like surface antigen
MRKAVVAVLVVALVGAAPTPLTADEPTATIKLGGGMFYNRNGGPQKMHPGGHVSLDLRLPEKNILFSPFGDVYRKASTTTVLGGVHAFAKPPMRSDAVSLYFGAGAGIVRQRYKTAVIDSTTLKSREVFVTRNLKQIDLVGGIEVRVSRTISIFVEPRYVRGDSTLSGLAAHAGLSFEMR